METVANSNIVDIIKQARNHFFYGDMPSSVLLNIEKSNPSISKSNPGHICYDRAGKRYNLTIRKYLIRIVKLNLSDEGINAIADKINNELFSKSFYVELLQGHDVKQAYRECIGGSSCMTTSNSDYVGLYCDNPKKVRLAVLKINNSSARCLIWSTDKGLWYDRIYSDSTPTKDKLEEILQEKNLRSCYRNEPKSPLKVEGLQYNEGEIPFFDSLKYGTISGQPINTLKISNIEPYDYILQNQDGSLIEGIGTCENCGGSIRDGDDYIIINDDCYICESCCEDYTTCDICNEYVRIDSIIAQGMKHICKSCLSNDYIECEDCGNYVLDDKICDINDKNICDGCLEDNYSLCSICNEYFENEYIEENGLCSDCFQKNFRRCNKCNAVHHNNALDNGICSDCSLEKMTVSHE